MKYIFIQIILLLFFTRLNAQVELVPISGYNFMGNIMKNYIIDDFPYSKGALSYNATIKEIENFNTKLDSCSFNGHTEKRIFFNKYSINFFRQYYSFIRNGNKLIKVYFFLINNNNGYNLDFLKKVKFVPWYSMDGVWVDFICFEYNINTNELWETDF
jgi:hypothetical protein